MSNGTLGKRQAQVLTLPLVFQTADADEAATFLSTAAVPYRSELLGRSSSFSTKVFGAHSPTLQISRVMTNGAMKVHAQLPEDSYAIVLGVLGELEHRVIGEHVKVCSESGLVQSPSQLVEVKTPERFELLFLKLSRDMLVQELEKLLDRSINVPLIFSPGFNVKTQAGRRFRQLTLSLCSHLGEDFKDDQRDGQHGLTARELESGLVTLLLEAQRHNYSRLILRNSNVAPCQVRTAEEFISANAHLTLSLGDICVAAGVGSRTLQHGFQRTRGYSPMQFLRRLRLERVHEDLCRPEANTTVTSAASRWGFLHFGRFAAEYHARFSEKPSETLRRAAQR